MNLARRIVEEVRIGCERDFRPNRAPAGEYDARLAAEIQRHFVITRTVWLLSGLLLGWLIFGVWL